MTKGLRKLFRRPDEPESRQHRWLTSSKHQSRRGAEKMPQISEHSNIKTNTSPETSVSPAIAESLSKGLRPSGAMQSYTTAPSPMLDVLSSTSQLEPATSNKIEAADMTSSSLDAGGPSHGEASLEIHQSASRAELLHGEGEDLWAQGFRRFATNMPDLALEFKEAMREVVLRGPSRADNAGCPLPLVRDVVSTLLQERLDKQWKARILGRDVVIRETIDKFVDTLESASEFIGAALAFQPYAQLAWIGGAMILPMIKSGSEAIDALVTGLHSINNVHGFWKVYDTVFPDILGELVFSDAKDKLIELCSLIFDYQASAICYLRLQQSRRAWKAATKKTEWREKAARVLELSEDCVKFSQLAQQKKADDYFKEVDLQYRALQQTIQDVGEQSKETREQVDKIVARQENQEEQAMMQALFANHDVNKNFNNEKIRGTFEWVQEQEDWLAWRKGIGAGVLAVVAGPGYGKSVLAKALIDEGTCQLQQVSPAGQRVSKAHTAVCHFFFKKNQDRRNRSCNALSAILHQLFSDETRIPRVLHKFKDRAMIGYKDHGQRLAESFEVLWEILLFCAGTEGAGEIICVLDALDECHEGDRIQLIEKWRDLCGQGNSHIQLKFLFTSQPLGDITNKLATVPGSHELRLDNYFNKGAVRRDIHVVVDDMVPQLLHQQSPELQSEVIQILKDRSRTFLWLRNSFEVLKRFASASHETLILHLEKMSLEETGQYEAQLNQQSTSAGGQDGGEHVRRLLELMLAASRPLMVSEAYDGLAAITKTRGPWMNTDHDEESGRTYSILANFPQRQPGLPRLRGAERLRRRRKDLSLGHVWYQDGISYSDFITKVRTFTSGLVTVYDDRLHFSHRTIRDFLQDESELVPGEWKWRGQFNAAKCHSTMALATMRWLSRPQYPRCVGESFSPIRVYRSSEFDNYAVETWTTHFHEHEQAGTAILNWEEAQGSFQFRLNQDRMCLFSQRSCSHGRQVHMRCLLAVDAKRFVDRVISVNLKIREDYPYNWKDDRESGCEDEYSSPPWFILHSLKDDRDEWTSLGFASFYGLESVVQLILKMDRNGENIGGTVDGPCGRYNTPLTAAAALGHHNVVALLLEAGAMLDLEKTGEETPLTLAIRGQHAYVVEILLRMRGHQIHVSASHLELAVQSSPSELNRYHESEEAAKIFSPPINSSRVLRLLLNVTKGDIHISPQTVARGTWSFATMVAFLQRTRVASITPEIWESAIGLGNDRDRALSFLAQHGDALQVTDGDGRNQLHLSSFHGDVQLTKIFLGFGISCNTVDNKLRTPFHLATMKGHLAVVQLLLDRKANIEQSDCDGLRALHYASANGNLQMIRLLGEDSWAQADLNAKDQAGESPLFHALMRREGKNSIEVTGYLLEIGADAIISLHRSSLSSSPSPSPDNEPSRIQQEARACAKWLNTAASSSWEYHHPGLNPLSYAVSFGYKKLTKKLLLGEAERPEQEGDIFGRTPLHYAIMSKCAANFQLLVDSHHACTKPDRYGSTPLSFASRYGSLEIVKALLSHNVDINAEDVLGRTALYWAESQKEELIVAELKAYAQAKGIRLRVATQNESWYLSQRRRSDFSGHITQRCNICTAPCLESYFSCNKCGVRDSMICSDCKISGGDCGKEGPDDKSRLHGMRRTPEDVPVSPPQKPRTTAFSKSQPRPSISDWYKSVRENLDRKKEGQRWTEESEDESDSSGSWNNVERRPPRGRLHRG